MLHVSQPTTAGTAVVVRELARASRSFGIEPVVASPPSGDLPAWCSESNIEWLPLPMTRQPGYADTRAVAVLRRWLEDDLVVHLHSSKAGALGRLAVATLRDRPRTVFTPHAWSWNVGGPMARAYTGFERWALRYTDCLVAVSEAEAQEGRTVLGAGARLKVIPNGVDGAEYSPDGTTASRSEGPLFVTVGRLSPQKGQDRAISALARFRDRSAHLRLVGDGPSYLSLKEQAKALGVAERVEFTGFSDPRPHLRAADVVLQPSRWEGMSLTLLEAMAMAKPVITTDCAGSEALIGVGVVVPQTDTLADRLVSELSILMFDIDKRRELGNAARRRAVTEYTWDQAVHRHLPVWDVSRAE